MSTAKLFTDGKGQAIRLPADIEFQGVSRFETEWQGASLVLTPCREPEKPDPYAHLPLGQALRAIARDHGVTNEDVEEVERNIAEHRRECRKHYKPVDFS